MSFSIGSTSIVKSRGPANFLQGYGLESRKTYAYILEGLFGERLKGSTGKKVGKALLYSRHNPISDDNPSSFGCTLAL